MKRGIIKQGCEGELYSCVNKPIKIVGISSSKRGASDCAREDPISLEYLKMALKSAEKEGAVTQLIDLRELKINPCKECYSTCPAQCRFNESTYQCDCYPYKTDSVYFNEEVIPLEEAYDKLSKDEFFDRYHNKGMFAPKDDLWIIYKALLEADGVIFASATNYYGRSALLQAMMSRLCAVDGGVEELWGDGKNLNNSIKYAKNPKANYKQRLYGKWCAFINSSKEGDSVTPNLMKACSMMGMKIIPLSVAYRVNWYDDPTHRSDMKKSLKDDYTISLVKHIGIDIVREISKSHRVYGIKTKTV